MAKKRNSLVANINRRKRKGTSRPKSKSTVSKQSYRRMQQGWPKTSKAKSSRKKAKSAKKRKTSKKKASTRK